MFQHEEPEQFTLTASGAAQGMWHLADMINDGLDPGDHDARDAWAIAEAATQDDLPSGLNAFDISMLVAWVWPQVRDCVSGPDPAFGADLASELQVDEARLRELASRPPARPRSRPSPFERRQPFAHLRSAQPRRR